MFDEYHAIEFKVGIAVHVEMSLNDDPSTLLEFSRSIIYCQLPICNSSPPTILHMYRESDFNLGFQPRILRPNMDCSTISDDGLAETSCHRCRDVLPAYEPLRTKALAEEERIEPPPYAVQQPGRSAFQNEHFYKHSPVIERKPHEHCDPFSSSNEDWTFHKRHVGSVPGAHWTRAIKRNNKIYYQYGVGKQKRLTPDFWFTCKMEPRANASEADVREICRVTAFALDYHRNHRYRRCACNFESLRESRGRCKLSWFHVYRKVTGHLISKGMDAHDRYCSCGCFDVQKRDVEY